MLAIACVVAICLTYYIGLRRGYRIGYRDGYGFRKAAELRRGYGGVM